MPGYKTHVTASSIGGAVLSIAAFHFEHVPLPSALLAGGLCAVGGIVPDIDSNNSQSFRHCMAIVAGFSSLMLVSRMRDFDLDTESVALIGGGVFIFCWFVLGRLIRKFTVHRGMCHSIPAVIIGSELIYILSSGDIVQHFLNAAAIGIGMLLHLVLDELNSFTIGNWGNIKAKKSLGSALKLFDPDHLKSSAFAFLLLFLLTGVAIRERSLTQALEERGEAHQASEYIDEHSDDVLGKIRRTHPEDFDRAVIHWAQDNDLVLQPGEGGQRNKKWRDLERIVVPNQ